MEGLTVKQKKDIVESNITNLNASIYDQTISKRVADTVNDESLSKKSVESLCKLEKLKDAYIQILSELEKEENKPVEKA